ncbi:MAG: hypothetical protein ACOX3P_03235 [Saccharofermentanales bacterium]|jgi:hypothetical protein|nr:hypothetical protein [Bacillota bacterium]NLB08383.1 hypothetical protein [Clostridiales bacterium]
MDYLKLLEISDDWLKYAIRLNLGHEPKDNLDEIRTAALADCRIKRYLSDIANFHAIYNVLPYFEKIKISNISK